MIAVIQTGGKQYKVQPGDILKIGKLDLEEGADVLFSNILMTENGEDIQIGTPFLNGITVSAEVLEQGRDKKINILKFRRRKHHMKHMGHRQYITTVKIKEIQGV